MNGFGVAYLRIPSMIVTLATNAVAQGLMVVYTGGFSPQDSASPVMRWLATGFADPRACRTPSWSGSSIGAAAVFLLTRTTFGRAVYGIGNRERAVYLSGVNTRRVVLIAFAIAGGTSAFGGVLLAGYASKAAQSMGDAYLLPSIAAVVLGGTHVLGGRGSYLGTVAGVILITLLQSILSVMQIEEAGPAAHLRRGDRRHAAPLRPPARLSADLSAAGPFNPAPRVLTLGPARQQNGGWSGWFDAIPQSIARSCPSRRRGCGG